MLATLLKKSVNLTAVSRKMQRVLSLTVQRQYGQQPSTAARAVSVSVYGDVVRRLCLSRWLASTTAGQSGRDHFLLLHSVCHMQAQLKRHQ